MRAAVLLGLALALSFAPSSASSAAPYWSNVDPPVSNDPNNPANNFGFNSVVVAPTTPPAVYVGTNRQGIWKSVDSGQTWAKANTGTGADLIDAGSQWSMAIDAGNPQVIYTTAARGVQGVLKSSDGGVSWRQVFAYDNPVAAAVGTNDIYSIAADPFVSGHLLASFHYYWNGTGDSGLIESLDGGLTWTTHNPAGPWSAGNGVYFGNDSATWIVGSQSAGVWITTDAGRSWRQITPNSITHGATQALYRDPATGALVLADGTAIISSSDNGMTWQDVSQGLPYAYFLTVISDGTTLFTAPSFPIQGDNGSAHGPWYARPLAGGAGWVPYSSQMPCDVPTSFCNGPVMGAYDASNHALYSVNWNGGAWKLQTAAPSPTSSPTPIAATPTATLAATSTPTPSSPTATATPSPTCQVEALVNGAPTAFTRPASFCTNQ
jgi:photosystem II stability/assembly factor-like uncharacterized protein